MLCAEKLQKHTFATGYPLEMVLKRVHLGFNPAIFKILGKLSAKWGLNTTSTIRHCIMLVAEQEGLTLDNPEETGKARKHPAPNK
jgi:hypothetical protein